MEVLNKEDIKLEVKNLNKKYDGKSVLKNISFSVKRGEFLAVLGLSGCGKTTLLRILIGLEKQDSGEILKEGEEIGRILDPLRGEVVDRILAPVDGVLFTIRDYPVVNNGSLMGRLLREEALK